MNQFSIFSETISCYITESSKCRVKARMLIWNKHIEYSSIANYVNDTVEAEEVTSHSHWRLNNSCTSYKIVLVANRHISSVTHSLHDKIT